MRIPIPNIPSNANEWELYSSMDGAELVADDLSSCLKKQCRKVLLGESSVEEAFDVVGKLMMTYVDFGARDSEPMYHAERVLRFSESIAAFVKNVGFEIDTP